MEDISCGAQKGDGSGAFSGLVSTLSILFAGLFHPQQRVAGECEEDCGNGEADWKVLMKV